MVRHRLRKRFPDSLIHDGANISDDSWLGTCAVLFPGATLVSSKLGRFSYLQANTAVYNAEIGPFCSIAANVTIGLAAHPTQMVSTSPVFYDCEQPLPRFFTSRRVFAEALPRTVVGADVWIGQGALIKAGVTIGVGAVIAAGAIVTNDLEPYTIGGGSPCRPIRSRFDEDLRMRLIASEWWKLGDSILERLADTFTDPQAFLAALAAQPGQCDLLNT
ncbi:MAG: CatB-related O-acetyltransferase [Longimicrobiales bacterium]